MYPWLARSRPPRRLSPRIPRPLSGSTLRLAPVMEEAGASTGPPHPARPRGCARHRHHARTHLARRHRLGPQRRRPPRARRQPRPRRARKSDREPSLHGLGVKPLKANTEKRTKPLKHARVDHANRGNGAGGERGTQAPDIQADIRRAAVGPGYELRRARGDVLRRRGRASTRPTSGFEPPDPWVAVGPDDVVQTVNTRIRFTNREGSSTAADVEVYDFFAFDELVPGDPNFITASATRGSSTTRSTTAGSGITLAWHCDTDGAGTADDSLGFVWGAISTHRRPDRRLLPVLRPLQLVPARLPGRRHLRRQVRDHGQRVRPDRRRRLHQPASPTTARAS